MEAKPMEVKTVEQNATKSLVDEMLEATAQREADEFQSELGLFDWPNVTPDDVEKRVLATMEAHERIRRLALQQTEPHHWVLMQDKAGHQYGYMTAAASAKLLVAFAVKVKFDGPPRLELDERQRHVAIVSGSWRSPISGVYEARGRAKRIQGEDFAGRKEFKKSGSRGEYTVGFDAELQDLRDAACTLFRKKAAMHCSGLVKPSVDYLCDVWGIPYDVLVRKATLGHGFTPEQRLNAPTRGAGAVSQPRPPQASGRDQKTPPRAPQAANGQSGAAVSAVGHVWRLAHDKAKGTGGTAEALIDMLLDAITLTTVSRADVSHASLSTLSDAELDALNAALRAWSLNDDDTNGETQGRLV